MKALHWLACISLAGGLLIVIFAVISLLSGQILFGFGHVVNFFHAANSFFLIAITLILISNSCDEAKKPV